MRLKSIFLTSAISIWLLISAYALYLGIVNKEWHLGLLLTSFLPNFFILSLFIRRKARTSRKLNVWSILILGGFGYEVYNYISDVDSLIILLLSLLSSILWDIYLKWYSSFGKRNSKPIKVGSVLPELEFKDSNGKVVNTARFAGKGVIYLFYRGNWCPLCMAQVKEISDQYKTISELGVEVALISPQPSKFTARLAKKMNVNFHFLVDEESKIAKELKIFVKGGTPFGLEVLGYDSDSVLPTVIICNKDAKIIYANQTDNYRVRPEPSTFIEILENQKSNQSFDLKT